MYKSRLINNATFNKNSEDVGNASESFTEPFSYFKMDRALLIFWNASSADCIYPCSFFMFITLTQLFVHMYYDKI